MLVRFAVAVLVAAVGVGLLRAEPVAVVVRTWVTPKPGQTPFDPPPDVATPEQSFALFPGPGVVVASFVPSDRWFTPDLSQPPEVAEAVRHESLFTFHAEVTDGPSGAAERFSLDGVAEAEWMTRPDGLFLPGTLAVRFAPPSDEWTPVGGNRYRLRVAEHSEADDRIGAEVSLTLAPAEVPEPGALTMIFVGVVSAGIGWRWKQRRAALTPDHLPL